MTDRKLTFPEALMLVAGAGIGTGILTLPYAIDKIGLYGTLLALAVAYGVSALLYLMIADLTRNARESDDLIAILHQHLFGNRRRPILRTLFLALLVLLLLENLVVYILCASDVLGDLCGISSTPAKLMFYGLASLVVLFGIRGLGVGEKLSVGLIGVVVLLLMILSCLQPKGEVKLTFGDPGTIFAVYGLFMFAFSAIFSIIQVCNHIANPALTGKAVLGGLTLNALITLLFSGAVILGSAEVTEIATIGLAAGIGLPLVRPLCSVLVLLAMLSSFWSSGFAFADVVSRHARLGSRWAWLIATLPAVLLATLIPLSVLDYVQLGAGALSVILVIAVLPAYRSAVKAPKTRLLLGRIATGKGLIVGMAVAIGLMTVASFVPIN